VVGAGKNRKKCLQWGIGSLLLIASIALPVLAGLHLIGPEHLHLFQRSWKWLLLSSGFAAMLLLFTFALGTAAGDLLSKGSGLGYDTAGMIFATGIVAIAMAYYFLKMNAILAFWLAYILIRPLGASMGDLLSKPVAENGIGMGTVGTSALFVTIIFGLVLFLTVTKKDQVTIPHETEGIRFFPSNA